MKNRTLAEDYIRRANARLAALDVLFELKSWADVVREAQEVVELALKSLLRTSHIEVPRLHDVSQILLDKSREFPKSIQSHLERMADISRSLRRDRELAFSGSEDLTPSDFYRRPDAEKARLDARWLVTLVTPCVLKAKRWARRKPQSVRREGSQPA